MVFVNSERRMYPKTNTQKDFMCAGDPQKNVIIGALLAIIGNCFISASFQIQKSAHTANVQQVSYIKLPRWWLGMLLMAGGEIGNFLAYGYAPATLVAPLGSVSVISNAVMSPIFLHEKVTLATVVGVSFALVGSVVVVLCAPESCDSVTEASLQEELLAPLFLVFLACVLLIPPIVLRVFKTASKRYVAIYVMVCGMIGCITVMSSKGISTAFRDVISGDPSWFKSWLVYVLIASVVPSILIQMRYLNLAMITFGASAVVPVYYVIFNGMSITAAMILYREFYFGTAWKIAGFVCGIAFTVIGIFVISKSHEKKVSIDITDGMQQPFMTSDGSYEPMT